MEVVSNNYMPSDPRLVQQLVYELKSQGIFDQFRKECISDVDTKPAYQNLRQRVEGSVSTFLSQQTWRPDMNKNQEREQLRKSIYESGFLETGVERIVDQVVNPKINTIFLPQVEDVVYRYLGIEKPSRQEVRKEIKIDVSDLLPTDLEAVSPESDHTKDDSSNLNDSINFDSKLEEDESPPFEPLDCQQNDAHHDENSIDSHLSGFSGLQSHESNPPHEIQVNQIESLNQDSQVSRNSSESHLSIITSEDNTKMEVCEDSDSKDLKTENSSEAPINVDRNSVQEEVEVTKVFEKVELDKKYDKLLEEKVEDKSEEEKVVEKKIDKKREDKKYDKKSEDKNSRSSDKYSSKDRKDDKHKKSSKSKDRSKDKSSSRHSSSSSRDKDRKEKDRKESKGSSSSNKEKEKPKKDKEKSNTEKEKSEKDKDKSKSSSSSNSSKHSSSKDKSSSSASKKESSSKDKQRLSSSSTSKDSKSKSSHSDSKSKSSSSDKHKKEDKSSHNGKHSSSSKKDKDKKRDSKKDSKDDHYSSKEKKNDRRSTDRDSNDGQSSRQGQSNSFPATTSSCTQKTNQESSNSNSGSGSGDSGNSDQIEHKTVKSPMKIPEMVETNGNDVQMLKYIKPKFASNFQEARILMKVRRQLAKLERQNQLSFAHIEASVEIPPIVNGVSYPEKENIKVNEVDIVTAPKSPEQRPVVAAPKDLTPILQSTELSKESWEALEARLAQEMSTVNYNSYESYDDYDYTSYNAIIISPRKNKITEMTHVVAEEVVEETVIAETCQLSKEKEKTPERLHEPVKTLVPDGEETPECSQIPVNKAAEVQVCVESERKLIIQLQREEKVDNWETVEQNLQQSPENTEHLMEERIESMEPDVEPVTDNPPIELPPKTEPEKTCDTDDCCRYLEKPSAIFERNLHFLYSYISKLERDVEHSLKASQNNFLSTKRSRKRKLEENVDVKNNNKVHFEPTTETKKRRRSVAPNPPKSVANREKLCNSTDISPNDSFSLPLSPAESDKSKEEESPKMVKQKRALGRATTRSQRYSSDDLYKPRPIFASTRRSRGAKNLE